MTSRDVDRLLTTWLAADAPASEPEDLLARVLAQSSTSRRRPAWLIAERWFSVQLTMHRVQLPGVATAAVLVALLLAALIGLAIIGSPRRLPSLTGPAGNGDLVFVSGGQLWTSGADGSSPRALTADATLKGVPHFSNDGLHVAYLSYPEGVTSVTPPNDRESLVVAKADGSDPVTIVHDVQGLRHVDWSVDGGKLAFSYWDAITDGQRDRIFVTPPDGSSPPVRIGDPDLSAFYPVFSDDGARIAFVSDHYPARCAVGECSGTTTFALYVMAADGTDVRVVAKGAIQPAIVGIDRWAPLVHWSADGRTLLFTGVELRSPSRIGLYVVDADGRAEPRRIDASPGQSYGASWSPDGTRIVYVHGQGGTWEIVVADADGSDPRVIATDVSRVAPRWSPDGRSVAFLEVDQTAEGRIRIVSLDGSPEVTIPITVHDPLRPGGPGIDAIAWQRAP